MRSQVRVDFIVAMDRHGVVVRSHSVDGGRCRRGLVVGVVRVDGHTVRIRSHFLGGGGHRLVQDE